MWVMVGLVCGQVVCTWMAPAFDTGARFKSESACVIAMAAHDRGIYKELACRRDR